MGVTAEQIRQVFRRNPTPEQLRWIEAMDQALRAAREQIENRERPLVEQLERAKRRSRVVYIDGKPIDLTKPQDLENAVQGHLTPKQKAERAKAHLVHIERYRT